MSASPVQTALSQGPCSSFHLLAARYLEEYLGKIHHAVSLLDEEQLWWRPAPGTNSLGNLLLHLTGNLSLWLGQGLGEVPYARDRAGEFTAERSQGREALLGGLTQAVAECRRILTEEDGKALDRPVDVQGYQADALGVIFHAVEHMSYHTGQILWAAKQALGQEHGIEFYPRHRDE
jgi:uncharacterized damage-inducible protein DinB